MRKLFFASLLVGMAGCASQSPRESSYGNFVQDAAPSLSQTIAQDAVRQLAALYPPANTRFDLQQAAADRFGTSLVESLRTRGYAVSEYRPQTTSGRSKSPSEAIADYVASLSFGAPPLPFRYVLDQPRESDLYRVTLVIGNQALTRVYLAQDGAVHPAGYWVRRE